MRRLLLLRHAKSSWADPGLDDHDRPLAPRGRRAARLVHERLARDGVEPDLVLCSTAARAVATLDAVRPALGDPVVRLDAAVYHASAAELLDLVRRLPGSARSAMVVGHNPGLQDLALLLAAPSPGRDRIAGKLPTGALVTLTLAVASWDDVAPGSADVDTLLLPRELERP